MVSQQQNDLFIYLNNHRKTRWKKLNRASGIVRHSQIHVNRYPKRQEKHGAGKDFKKYYMKTSPI